jgi:hypothetical protein
MNLEQHLTRDADVQANIIATQLARLESQVSWLSNRGRQTLDEAFARFVAATREPTEERQEFRNGSP